MTRTIRDPQVLARAIDIARTTYSARWADEEHGRQRQRQQQTDASNARADAIIADLSSRHPSLTAAQIGSDPALMPDARRALLGMYQRFSGSDTAAADHTYGPGFWTLYKRATAPQGDPSRIADPAEIMRHAGPGGDLTLKGVAALTKIVSGRGTPQAEAWTQMERQLFQTAKADLSGADPMTHLKDPKGEDLLLQFMAHAIPVIEKARAEGKSPSDVFDPKSPDYIGAAIATLKRPQSVLLHDLMQENAQPGAQPSAQLDTPSALAAAFHAGSITREEAQQIALARGWIAAPAPNAPAAAPAAPNLEQKLEAIGAGMAR